MNNEHYVQFGVAMTCRSFAEYTDMFSLDFERMGEGRILDVAGGASSFAAEAALRGYKVTAADPQYALPPEAIVAQGEREIETSAAKLSQLVHKFDWSYYGDLANHKAARKRSLRLFAEDYAKSGGRYVAASLPELPFPDNGFDLVLCSHFLFLYREQFDDEFHLRSVLELARVCRPGGEIRIYPLLSLKWEPYPHMDSLRSALQEHGLPSSLMRSNLPFIPNSAHLLQIRKPPRD